MANAGCINAIWFDWCFLQTLQQLDSACIWVWVQFTAPNPLDDKRFDYIKYTDKCWNTCCLTWENEIMIYATQWTLKNLTLTNDDANEVVNVKRTDVFWSNWKKTVVRYKTWWYPTSITDWTLAVEELVQNQYQSSWYNVSWLTDWTTYYFSAFAVAQDDTIIVVQTNSITTDFEWKPSTSTLARRTLNWTLNDSSWNWRNATWSSNMTYQTLSSWIKVAKTTTNNWWITVNWNIANLLSWDFTISMRTYTTWQWLSNTALMFWVWYDYSPYVWPNIRRWYNWDWKVNFRLRWWTSSQVVMMSSSTWTSSLQNKRIHICRTRISWNNVAYIDAVQECSMTSTLYTSSWNSWYILSRYTADQSLATWSMSSNVIVENRWRTATEVQSYRNKTKRFYWIS
jgi:hypothetical protein